MSKKVKCYNCGRECEVTKCSCGAEGWQCECGCGSGHICSVCIGGENIENLGQPTNNEYFIITLGFKNKCDFREYELNCLLNKEDKVNRIRELEQQLAEKDNSKREYNETIKYVETTEPDKVAEYIDYLEQQLSEKDKELKDHRHEICEKVKKNLKDHCEWTHCDYTGWYIPVTKIDLVLNQIERGE